ncbi:Ribonuclease H-like superfamily [Sesbania bispinosa]|nr:Ribonuclease H-like superfamily [Sesbania bispinosa]
METAEDVMDPMWKMVSRWNCPQRAECFLWLVLHIGLETRSKAFAIHIADSAICPACGLHKEITLHILKDCYIINDVWEMFGVGVDGEGWKVCDIREWVLRNLDDQHDSIRSIIFNLAMWRIWKARNAKLYENKDISSLTISSEVNSLAHEVQLKSSTRHASCGGVFRGADGRWIMGFALNLSSSSILLAELRVITTTLQIAWQKGFKKIWVESDSKAAIHLISEVPAQTREPAAISLQDINFGRSSALSSTRACCYFSPK